MPLGYKHTPQAIAKIIASNKTRIVSEETKRKIGIKSLGRFLSIEARKKIGIASKKNWDNPEYRIRRGSRLGIKFSADHKDNIRKSQMGDKHWNWKGGITLEQKRIRHIAKYKDWRTLIFKRDDYRCFDCGARSEEGRKVALQADHIFPFSLFPRLRFDINNGRTLCIDCHKQTSTYGGRIVNYQTN